MEKMHTSVFTYSLFPQYQAKDSVFQVKNDFFCVQAFQKTLSIGNWEIVTDLNVERYC